MSDVGNYVRKQLSTLNALRDTSGGKAKLALLRRGAGKVPGEIPELWGAFLTDIPEKMLSQNGDPTYGEWAVYLALTLFAVHQQGHADFIHTEGIGLGSAASSLMDKPSDEERERILRRFGPVVTAKDMVGLSYHLRSFIQLMSSKSIGLDYVMLAEDIYSFQFLEQKKKVQLKWGQDFYYTKKTEGENE